MGMSIGTYNPQQHPTEQTWLTQFLSWFMIPTFAVCSLVSFTFSLILLQSIWWLCSLILLSYTGVLFWTRKQARAGHLRRASTVISAGLLIIALLIEIIVPAILPAVMILPMTAVIVALPYLNKNHLRYLIIIAGITMLALVILSHTLPVPAAINYASAIPAMVITIVITIITLLLLQQQRDRLNHLLEQARASNAQLQSLQASLEAEVLARTADLRHSEERYRMISEMTSDYIYVLRVAPNGEVFMDWITGAFEQVTTYTVAEIGSDLNDLNGAWCKVFHPDDLATYGKHFQRLLANQESVAEFRIMTRQGEVRWLRDHARSLWDEQQQRVVGIIGAARDITERKQAEYIRQRSEERFTKSFQCSPVPMAISRFVDGCFLDVNDSFVAASGYSREEVIGRSSQDEAMHFWSHPGDRAMLLEELQAQGRIHNKLFSFRQKSGTIRQMLLSIESIELDNESCLLATLMVSSQ